MILITILVIGICLGPSLAGLEIPAAFQAVSKIAGAGFLFIAGWEIRFLSLRSKGRFYLLGFAGAFGVPFLAGIIFFPGQVFLAAAFGISALPVAIQILKEKERYDSELSRKTVMLASLCDLAAWALIFFIIPIDTGGDWIRSHWFIFMFFIGLVLSQWRAIPVAALRIQKWILAPLFFIGLGSQS